MQAYISLDCFPMDVYHYKKCRNSYVGIQSILFHQVGQLGLIQFRAVQYIVQYRMRLRRDGEDSLFCVGT